MFAFGGLTNSFWLMCFARFVFGWVYFSFEAIAFNTDIVYGFMCTIIIFISVNLMCVCVLCIGCALSACIDMNFVILSSEEK